MVSLREKLRKRAQDKKLGIVEPEPLQAPIMVDNETPREVRGRHLELQLFALAAQQRELPRWEAESNASDARLTMLETETAAKILATNPDIDLLFVLQCIGVPGTGYGKDLIVPLAYRCRDAIESRARRIRTTLQNLQPDEIHRVSVDYLVSVIDDDAIGHKTRIKAVETLAKLALSAQKGQDDEQAKPVTVATLVEEIRANVLGIKKVE